MLAIKAGAQSSALIIFDSLYTTESSSPAIHYLEKQNSKSETVNLKLTMGHQATGDPQISLKN